MVDLSYKDDAFRVYYDIEALPSLFTVAFWHKGADGAKSTALLWFYGDSRYDRVPDSAIEGAFREYVEDPYNRKFMDVSSPDEVDVVLERFREGDHADMARLRRELAAYVTCTPPLAMRVAAGGGDRFTEYVGWNSWNYDLPMLVLIKASIDSVVGDDGMPEPEREITPLGIRQLSDAVIGYDGAVGKVCEHVYKEMYKRSVKGGDGSVPLPSRTGFRRDYGDALWWDGHIDIAKMLRSADDNSEQRFPPGLKKEEAKLGMDIIADGAVSISDPSYTMPDAELLGFVKYNLHDVIAAYRKGESVDVRNRIFVRDVVRKMFPYTASRATPRDKAQTRWMAPERDITEAQLTALSLIGERRIKPTDYGQRLPGETVDGRPLSEMEARRLSYVNYRFPVPDGNGGFRHVDLLEHMRATEPYMPDDIYAFFDHWRGRDTFDWDGFFRLVKNQPLTHATAANVPYYRRIGDEWRPIDSYIRVSTGGAHGSVMAGLSEMTPEEVSRWTRADSKPKPELVPTLDLDDVVHADFTSYYPYLMTKMQAFLTSENVDRFHEIYDRRVAVKAELAKTPDKTRWGPRERDMSDQQLGLKLQLNSATGKANTHREYALLPLDNKILSMRLIGNMSIWCLAQRMVHAGGFVVSTNTDGIYVANITVDAAQGVIDGFVDDYGILVDPETVSRFVNRDVSNRMEFIHKGYPNDVRGTLRSAGKIDRKGTNARTDGLAEYKVAFDDAENGHSVGYPLAVGNAVVRYIAEDRGWLEKPYDRDRMVGILEDIRSKTDAMSWVKIQESNHKNRLLVGGELTQKVDRVALTKDGLPLTQESYRKIAREQALVVWRAAHDGRHAGFADVAHEMGVKFAGNILSADMSGLRLGKKTKGRGRRDPDIIEVCPDQPSDMPTEEEFYSLWRSQGATCLLYDWKGEWREVKAWNPSQLSGYGAEPRGVLLDRAGELESFDMSRLDMAQYLEWAESILRNWRVAGDLSEDGRLTPRPFDDLLTPANVRKTKRQEAIDVLLEAYSTILGPRRGAVRGDEETSGWDD